MIWPSLSPCAIINPILLTHSPVVPHVKFNSFIFMMNFKIFYWNHSQHSQMLANSGDMLIAKCHVCRVRKSLIYYKMEIKWFRFPTRSLFPEKVLDFDNRSSGHGKVLNFVSFSKQSWKSSHICQKQVDKLMPNVVNLIKKISSVRYDFMKASVQ